MTNVMSERAETMLEKNRRLIAEGEVILATLRRKREAALQEAQDMAEREAFAAKMLDTLRFIGAVLERRA